MPATDAGDGLQTETNSSPSPEASAKDSSAAPGDASAKQPTKDEVVAQFAGKEYIMRSVAGVFIDTYPEMLEELRRGVADRDKTLIEDTAHKLKGAVGNFTTGRPFELARELEHMGHEGSWEHLDDTFDAFEYAVKQLEQALSDMIS